MKILHVCLSCFYIDNYSYQENILPIKNQFDGHEVKIIASTESYIDNLKLGYIEAKSYQTNTGINIDRLPYDKILTDFISYKVRKHNEFKNKLKELKPDVILFHGLSGWELLTVAEYKKNNPYIKFYVDSHADFNNSSTNFLSKYLLHKVFYKYIIKKAYPFIDKILYVSYEVKDFLKANYNLTEEKMEFYPLGGNVLPDDERERIRINMRKELHIYEDQLLFIHSGKMDKLKRTEEIIIAFSKVKDERFKLILIGNIPSDIYDIISPMIEKDSRINYLGWKSSEELNNYLCACDVYLQPGSQSATMQNAMCCGAAVMLYPHKSHKPYLVGNGFYVETVEDMVESLKKISDDINIVEKMRNQSIKIAKDILDYKKLAARLYS